MLIRIRYFQNYESFKRIFGENQFAQNVLYPTFGLQLQFVESENEIINNLFNKARDLSYPCLIDLDKQYFVVFGDLNLINNFSYIMGIEIDILKNLIQKLLKNYESANQFKFKIGDRVFSGNEKYVMGILNVTTDSFYDGGKYFNEIKIKQRIDELISAGVDIIDIGGESTRPGSEPVTAEDELRRILPAVEYALSKNAIVSVDTYKSVVAEETLKLGVHIINDISGFKFDRKLKEVCKKFNATVVLMHIRGTPKTMQQNPYYLDTMAEIFDELEQSISIAQTNELNQIFIDPGVGFGKRLIDNYEILNRLEELKFLGFPILVGLSRKSFIGKFLNIQPDERLAGTIATNAIALLKGASIIRVHDPIEAFHTKRLVEAILNTDLINT